jgi:3-dehydroquinate synthase
MTPTQNQTIIEVKTSPTPGSSYQVLVEDGLLTKAGSLIRQHPALQGSCVILSDDRVAPLYAQSLTNSLQNAGYAPKLITVPAGEKSKSMAILEEVCGQMVTAGLDRSSFLIALGGGVIGDLGGFAAAIYFRGIPLVQIPTTIVAQVDSSVGGKTGLNLPQGKNLVGSFHQPALVLADPLTLRSLPPREFTEGLAEMVKHAAIRDPAMLEQIPPAWTPNLAPIIARNIAIKAAIVTADEKETTGERALLNFGHTIGHAIENAAGYGKFLHGEAISLGLIVALQLSRQLAGLSAEDACAVQQTLQRLGLPLDLRPAPPPEALLASMRTDKKFSAGQIRFVLLRRLGDAFLSSSVTEPTLLEVLEQLRAD